MKNETFEMITMSATMFIITFFFGYLPSKMPLSKRSMNLVSIFGAGLLCGVSLLIIMPEGIEVVYKAKISSLQVSADTKSEDLNEQVEKFGMHFYIGLSLMFGFAVMLIIDQGFHLLHLLNEKQPAQQLGEQEGDQEQEGLLSSQVKDGISA